MSKTPDYYQLLQVLPDAPEAIIKASYRAHMQKLGMHPDLGGDPEVAALLNKAYEVLSNPVKREAYNRSIKQEEQSGPQKTSAPVEQNPYEQVSNSRCPFCQSGISQKNINDASRCVVCSSPLLPVTKLATMNDNCQRDIFRVEQDKSLAFCTVWPQPNPYPGKIRDYSPNGMQLISPVIVAVGDRIKFYNKTMQGVATCVSCQKDTKNQYYRLGFSFLTLNLTISKGNFLSLST